ncbi:sel1 repeat family protein [Acinetobacter gyllenbergii]|uniref:sel1 repeat family protein n=1 Tax=Acinetobacter gyllenbergii TaxID=134534 RepID=UPI000806C143|nr:sel1 repeat family protein [Acinetobacter gyllenbergii]MCU4580498.1 sel1 repeat family protein [Acinetobacter gyllenbergii]OBY74887.1 hypothetical protein NG55_08100 [Acinetobacter gyllenbergii]
MNKKINYLCFSLWICLFLSACTKTTLDKDTLDGSSTAPSLNPVFNSIVNDIKNQEVFRNNLQKCPASSSPILQILLSSTSERTINACEDNQSKCYQLCLKNDAVACYFSALSLQEANHKLPAEQLFQRSCELGVASGCTNRAAGMLSFTEHLTAEQKKCIFSTFEKTCDWRDPWGCTMFADQLISEENTEPNYKKALNVLNYSCKYGNDDPACQSAKELRKFINSKNKPE